MLILTRRVGEKLVIGENVTVTVLGVKGNQIRIGIDAPPEVQVHREEIFQRILKEREEEKRLPVTSSQFVFTPNQRTGMLPHPGFLLS